MMISQSLLRQNAYEMPLAEAIRQTNDALVRNNEQCLFVTVWLAKLELSTGHITYINAGHNPALLTNPAKDKRLWLEELSGPVLGLMPDIPYTRHSALLPPGHKLLIFTVGLNEAENQQNEFYGDDRLREIFLKAKSPEEIMADIACFVGNASPSDDKTYLWIERR